MAKIVHIRLPDAKVGGLWQSYKSTYAEGKQILSTHESQLLFNLVKSRCDKSSKYIEKFRTYEDCVLGFKSFQDFAEWCNTTPGYGQEFNGKRWCIDKDILFKGNKVYSEHTCCFVPEFVNNFFALNWKGVGELPIGVTKAGGRSKKFRSRCGVGATRLLLGNFTTPEEAHHAWLKAKHARLEEIIEIYNGLAGSTERVITALRDRLDFLATHIENRQILTSL